MRIGILGGTFDPPHKGHIALALAAKEALELDEVLLLPAHRNPLKHIKAGASPKHRLAMCEAVIKEHPGLGVCDLDISRGGPSYAVDTLAELHAVQDAEYWFILGSDAIRHINSWKAPERLMKLCRFAVATRSEKLADFQQWMTPDLAAHVDLVPMPPVDISATELRNKIAKRESVNLWIPPTVIQYIQEHNLYRDR